jgi:MFS family permease
MAPPLSRSISAVLVGTFTLRFSTGLTGGLLVYYLAALGDFPSGRDVSAFEVGVLGATYFLAELVLSPLFGIGSDRIGFHRIMQVGPAFGAVAVVMTAFTTDVTLLALTRWLEGAAAAASIPSILGYIALVTSRDEPLRGRVVARFEAATLAGIGFGVVAAGPLFEWIERGGFLLNGAIYGVSFAIYRWGVGDDVQRHGEGLTPVEASPARDWSGYRRILSTPAVWLLAPTWIAVNAFIGAWTSQSIFQLVADRKPGFEDQLLMGGFNRVHVSAGLAVALLVFFAGLLYWGARFARLRRTTIIAVGIGGGLAMIGAIFALNHAASWGVGIQAGLALFAAAGLFVLAGATPAALGLLADISEIHPDDRGVVMGLYSVFLAVGQIVGALIAGGAADWQGVDGLLAASLGLLLLALVPLGRLRTSEHLLEAAHLTEP